MDVSDKILLLRYSDFNGVDTIAEHKNVLASKGHCWWAKLGKQPGKKYLKPFLEKAYKTVLLYTSGKLYKCALGKVINGKPEKDYPEYYNSDIFGTISEPSIFFELLSIEKLEVSFLNDYIVTASGDKVLYALKKSISSYMYIQHKDTPLPPKPTPGNRKNSMQNGIIDNTSCQFKKNGKCNNKYCVDYEYECNNPRYCFKRRPVKNVKPQTGDKNVN